MKVLKGANDIEKKDWAFKICKIYFPLNPRRYYLKTKSKSTTTIEKKLKSHVEVLDLHCFNKLRLVCLFNIIFQFNFSYFTGDLK